MIKYIHLDYRKPQTKEEAECWAITHPSSTTADVFINRNKHKKASSLMDTFFHEMTHVFLAFHGKEGQMTWQQEEKLCKEIGKLCAEALK